MSDIIDQELFNQLNTLKLSLNLRLTNGQSGMRKSTAKGQSVEFSDFREYMAGDDIRRIDWNAYGRFDKLYIKEFMEEKEGLYRIFLDTSSSMNYGEVKKSDVALKLTAAISYLVLGNLDRVYINELAGENVVSGKGKAGRNSFGSILNSLENIAFNGSTNLTENIRKCPVTGSGCSIIISDFLDYNSIEPALKLLAYKKQQIVLLEIMSKEERHPSLEGNLSLYDMEDNSLIRLTANRKNLENYNKNYEMHEEALEDLARKYRANLLHITSEEDILKIFYDTLVKSGILTKK